MKKQNRERKIKDENLKRNEKIRDLDRIEKLNEFLEKYSIFIKKKWERELKMQIFMNGMRNWYSRKKIEDIRRNIAE